MLRALAVFAACLFVGQSAVADDAAPAGQKTVQQFVDSLHFQTGTVKVARANASLKLDDSFRYLDARDAQRVLEQLWGNPPDADVLGMLVPTAAPLTEEKGSWAVVVTYSNDGYVSDAEAGKIDYTKMLHDMQEATHEANAERKQHGYPAVDLVGWAEPPHYDAASNKLYWAKDLAFGDGKEHTLNYDIRVLGRGGYLSLNAVAGMSQLDTVKAEMPKVLAMTEFDPGQRYADFNSSTDKIAAYGIGALVAGTLAAKAGLFAKLFAMLLAFKKVIIGGAIALFAAAGRLFGRKSKSN